MYIIKKDKKGKNGISSYYWLVESARDGDKTKLKNLLYLGNISITDSEKDILGKLIERKIKEKPTFCKFSEKLETLSDDAVLKYNLKWKTPAEISSEKNNVEYVELDLNSLDHSYSRTAGAETLALEYWKKLGFDQIFEQCHFRSDENDLAKAVIIGRLISPGSELHTYHWLKRETILPEFLPSMKDSIPFNPLYFVGDQLYAYKSKIEHLLRHNLKKLYPQIDIIFLFDLTNTYTESSKVNSDLCKRGKSKEKRSDCPLVTLALVVDQDGFPVYSSIFRGNQSEPATLQEILYEVYESQDNFLMSLMKPAIVMDRGIATKSNLDYLRDNGYSYFVIERRDETTDYQKEFEEKERFTHYKVSGKKDIYLRQIFDEDCVRVLVLSAGKKNKEDAIISRKESRFLEDAKKLIKSNCDHYIKNYDKITIRIGRLKERYGSITNCYKFTLVKEDDNSEKVKEIKLSRTNNTLAKKEHAGCYVIRTDKRDLSAKEIWDLYMNLTEVESSFKALKSELGARPLYHQKDKRIEAHLFISVLAYYLLRSITYSLGIKGYDKSWKEIRDIMRMHIRSTIYFCNREGNHYQIRMTGLPEKGMKEIYDLLNIKINRHKKIRKISDADCSTQKKLNSIIFQ
jgi:hypothetical protein